MLLEQQKYCGRNCDCARKTLPWKRRSGRGVFVGKHRAVALISVRQMADYRVFHMSSTGNAEQLVRPVELEGTLRNERRKRSARPQGLLPLTHLLQRTPSDTTDSELCHCKSINPGPTGVSDIANERAQ